MNEMKSCGLCARGCRADRTKGAGRCGVSGEIRAARAALHMWEEPCISGKEGSGAIFFSGCPLGCVFCQNREIALGNAGNNISVRHLAEIMLSLEQQGANNINLVTPTQYVPQIIEAVKMARSGIAAGSVLHCPSSRRDMSDRGRISGSIAGKADIRRLSIPIVYNTGSYETTETVDKLAGIVDIFLPDLKYFSPELSQKYSAAPDYFSVASKAITRMAEISGPCVFDGRGMLKKGTIIRHLVLPGHTEDSKKILRWVYSQFRDNVYVSIMNQYTPMPGIEKFYPELGRKVTRREYDKVVNYAIDLGIENAYIQEGGTQKESFIPAFDGEGL